MAGAGGGGPDNFNLSHQHSLTANSFGFNLYSFLTVRIRFSTKGHPRRELLAMIVHIDVFKSECRN